MTPPTFPDQDDPAAPPSFAGRPRVLVVGAGAIGGVIAARLARAGHDAAALDANREHVARLTSPGLRLDELGTPSVIPVPAVADMAGLRGPFDFALLTVKASFLEPVLTGLVSRPLVRTFVSLGNWLIPPPAAAITGPERLITGIAASGVRPCEAAGVRPADLAVHTEAGRPRGRRPHGAAEPPRAGEGVDVAGPRAGQPDRGGRGHRRGRRASGRARPDRPAEPAHRRAGARVRAGRPPPPPQPRTGSPSWTTAKSSSAAR